MLPGHFWAPYYRTHPCFLPLLEQKTSGGDDGEVPGTAGYRLNRQDSWWFLINPSHQPVALDYFVFWNQRQVYFDVIGKWGKPMTKAKALFILLLFFYIFSSPRNKPLSTFRKQGLRENMHAHSGSRRASSHMEQHNLLPPGWIKRAIPLREQQRRKESSVLSH